MRTLNQIIAVTMMNLRSLPQRFWTSLATVVAVALVTAVLLGFLGLANGFQKTMDGTGSDDVAIVLREGAGGELNSLITKPQADLMAEAPGIARDAAGKALVSPELYLVVDGKRRSTGIKANMPLRGVGANALSVRAGVTIVEGRMFTPGTAELVAGRGVVSQFEGFEIGQKVRLSGQDWTIVGIFDAGGSVFESEVWADFATLQGLFNRGSTVQTLRVRMETPGALAGIRAFSEADPRLKLEVKSEKAFMASQSDEVGDIIFFIGWPLAILMSFGALAGALNTMYASVEARMKEVATLRAIGFGGFPAFVGTMVEALVLAGLGGLLGAGGLWLALDGLSASTLGGGFTQVVFSIDVSGGVILSGIVLALIIGFAGGFFPAIRAARAPLLAAFRAN